MISETAPVTVTLDFLSWQGLGTLLAMLGIAVATALAWLMLNASERRPPATPDAWFKALAWVLLPVWLWILAATLWGLWLVFNGHGGPLGEGSLGLGALIAASLGAPFVIYGTWLRHKTNRLEQEGHMTDRITKAVEQLGADKIVRRDGVEESVPNIEVRMGAILSLERIAQDSTANDKGRDHVRVMEILCAYIRENSNARKLVAVPSANPNEEVEDEGNSLGEAGSGGDTADRSQSERHTQSEMTYKRGIRSDVELAIAVITRRNDEQLRVEAAWPGSLEASTIWPFDHKETALAERRLPKARSNGSSPKARIIRSGAHDRHERNTSYSGYRVDLSGSNFRSTSISDLLRSKKVLSGAFFMDCNAQDVRLCRCLLRCAIILDGSFDGADFSEAEMQGAWLAETSLEGAKFDNSCLHEAYFFGLKLDRHTSFKGAQLDGAALRSINLSAVELTQEQISSAFGDASVILPKGIFRPEHWPDWELPSEGEDNYNIQRSKWLDDPEGYRPPPKPK